MSRLARFVLLASAVAPALLRAEPPAAPPPLLPFEDTLRAAARTAPGAVASSARADAADAAAAKARRLPNPEASARVENWRKGTEAQPFDAATDLKL